jgi:hypothetical protein
MIHLKKNAINFVDGVLFIGLKFLLAKSLCHSTPVNHIPKRS